MGNLVADEDHLSPHQIAVSTPVESPGRFTVAPASFNVCMERLFSLLLKVDVEGV